MGQQVRGEEVMSSSAVRRATTIAVVALLASLLVYLPAPSSDAKGVSEPAAATIAWYWETQQRQEVKDPIGQTHTVMGPNPFCPSAPGDLGAPGQTCSQGRLPVEVVGGDYETPDKISAVNFDFSLVPLGSKITKFTVTFLEAKGGCYDKDGTEGPSQGDECERTDAINVADHQLQACQVNDFFGTGSARPYNEAPRFACTSSDPVAKRKEVELKGTDKPIGEEDTPDHVWTFDLTPLAKSWTSGTKQTSIMLFPHPPKDYDKNDQQEQDSWRVVLAGPEEKQGIVTHLKFTAPATPPPPPPTDTGTGDGIDTGTGVGSDFGTGSTDFGSTGDAGSDFGSGSSGTGDTTSETTSTDEATTGELEEVAAEAPEGGAESFPAYMWLAILAGLVAFSLVRSIVIEATTGIRPNGVLAQIKTLNAARTGGTAVAADDARGGGSVLGAIGHGFSSFAGKVKSIFRRG